MNLLHELIIWTDVDILICINDGNGNPQTVYTPMFADGKGYWP